MEYKEKISEYEQQERVFFYTKIFIFIYFVSTERHRGPKEGTTIVIQRQSEFFETDCRFGNKIGGGTKEARGMPSSIQGRLPRSI